MLQWIVGALIVADGAVTAMMWLVPAKADAPFNVAHSWLLGDARGVALVLAVVAALGFAVAGVGVIGHHPWWADFGVAAGALALALMVLYFSPWLLVGILISTAILAVGARQLLAP